MRVQWFFIIMLEITIYVESARILCVYNAPLLSHQAVYRPLSLELAKRGHELVVLTPLPLQNVNFTQIDISVKNWTLTSSVAIDDSLNKQKLDIVKIVTEVASLQLTLPEVQNLLHSSDHFDLVILETAMKLNYIFGYIFKAPTIVISSMTAATDNYEVFGAPTHPFLYPPSMPNRIYNLSIWEKIEELYGYLLFKFSYIYQEKLEDVFLKEQFGKDTPSIEVLANNVDMLFLNVHQIWEGNRPVPSGIVYLGGMHQTPEKELPKELKSYLDSSKNGVIYVSFGSTIASSEFPSDKLKMFLNVFSKLKYDVLFKWELDKLEGSSDNVKPMKWLPQADLLRHPNIKLFITQGGLQSTDEAITAGVPMVGLPILGDQWYHVEKYVHHGIGIQLDFKSFNEDQLMNAIDTVIHDKSYKENIVRLRELIYDRPESSLDRAVWWTEYVLRHGGARHLRSPAANMSWTTYYEVELLSYVLLAVLTVISVVLIIVYKLGQLVLCKDKRNIKLKKT